MGDPVHRTKAVLGNNKIVDRRPSSDKATVILFLMISLVAISLWFVEEEQTSDPVIKHLSAHRPAPLVMALVLQPGASGHRLPEVVDLLAG